MNLRSYDVILVNSSAGKDSQAMLDVIYQLAEVEGVQDRITVVHCDLGRVEWKGTRELAERQAAHYGARFEVVSRPQGDLLTHIEQRGMWPSSTARYCTSDHKRGQVRRVMTKLVEEICPIRSGGPQVRILNCMGMRADESPARAKLVPFSHDENATNGRRHVDTWLPLHGWAVDQVWTQIKASGVPHHYAYDLGMPRLSCCFCIFAPPKALALAAKHNPELFTEYLRVEAKIGHTFRHKFSLVQIAQALSQAPIEDAGPVENWCM